MSEIVTMMPTPGGRGGEGGGALPLHPVRPPRLPDLPSLSVPGGAHCQRGDERDAGRLVAPGVRQQPRRQAHRSVVSTKGCQWCWCEPGPNQPYLCPESRLSISPGTGSMNASAISYEWPVTFIDTVEWVQHPEKTGVFFHEENIFSLWTMKIMDFDATWQKDDVNTFSIGS